MRKLIRGIRTNGGIVNQCRRIVIMLSVLAFADATSAKAESADLDCWLSVQNYGDIYVGWLHIDITNGEILWSKPLRSEDGPNGELTPPMWKHHILNDPFAGVYGNGRENWVQSVGYDSRSFLFVNRETGRFLFNSLEWKRQGPERQIDFQLENIEGFCEARKA